MKQNCLSAICLAVCAAGILSGCTPKEDPVQPTAMPMTDALTAEETTEASADVTTEAAETTKETVTLQTIAATTETETVTTEKKAPVTTQAPASTAAPESTEAQETTTAEPEAPRYSEDMLQYLAMHYYGSRHNWIPQFIDVDKVEGDTVTLHLYDLIDGHTSTADWYYVSNQTGKGKNFLEEEIDLTEKPKAQWRPDVPERNLLPKDASCGIIYLGYPEIQGRYSPINAAYREYFSQKGYVDQYPYIANMPEENYAETNGGNELYLIIPRDSEAQVVVNAYDDNGRMLGRIYSSYSGAPFLLRCNRSEVMTDQMIKIVDNAGEYEEFSVYISGRDGKPKTDSARAVILEPEK